jgi:NCAIR mutase (PurE)-related protein
LNEFSGERRAGMIELVSTVAQQGEQIVNIKEDISEIKGKVAQIHEKLTNGLTSAVNENTKWREDCQEAEINQKTEKSKRNWQLWLAVGTAIVAPFILKMVLP